jgi:microcystin-dependent protein
MTQPYVGEIRLMANSFAPVGWAFCDGTPMAIAENETLFQLIGTTYGGDGEETFNLPDLRGRIPMHMGTGPDGTTYQIGEMSGVEQVTLNIQQIPNHSHGFLASTANATVATPSGNVLAQTPSYTPYIVATPNAPLNANSIQPAGGSQPHENMQPILGINFIISLYGIFPSQT